MLQYKKFTLNELNIEELASVFDVELRNYFSNCKVSVEECPDLTKAPFNLAAPGLSGNTAIADVGGVPYLTPLPQKDRIYSFEQIARIVNIGMNSFMIGAGAGPFHKVGHNCELMPNVFLQKENDNYRICTNNTYFSEITSNNDYRLVKCSAGEFALLGNFFISEGKPGKVIKIVSEKRIAKDNFPGALQNILKNRYNHPISMGGVFLIEKGDAKLHIMPDFSSEPLNSNEEVDRWLRFFEMNSPLVCLTTLHSIDPDLKLRMEHTHCFSDHNQGGHYHYDTTPDNVKYVAYLNVAQSIYRIDQPT